MSGQVDSEDLQVDLMMPSSTYGSHIPTTSKATTADTDANVNRWKEDNVEENKAVSGGKSSNATRSCHDLTVFEESEHLVTADDVSSSMFTDSVLTGIEAPEKATILMDCESWRYADEDAESRDADLDSCQYETVFGRVLAAVLADVIATFASKCLCCTQAA
ncbi:unnamed protein product [Haemonchus placei]|uniref:Uncharacterized protein n=1 Tax=Haemonchus placei TaxID=6290 RepID=A0A0N4X782_HAEPC|nr:unnamed protein product [Haemonchus placei]